MESGYGPARSMSIPTEDSGYEDNMKKKEGLDAMQLKWVVNTIELWTLAYLSVIKYSYNEKYIVGQIIYVYNH